MQDLTRYMLERITSDSSTEDIFNYVLPGVKSSLVALGRVRLLESTRETVESVTPHSHRYHLVCIVLRGWVRNRTWFRGDNYNSSHYAVTAAKYNGEPGKHEITQIGDDYFEYADKVYNAGDSYYMESTEIHSVYFGKGAKILVFQGPDESEESVFLQPIVNDKVIPTHRTEPWMYKP